MVLHLSHSCCVTTSEKRTDDIDSREGDACQPKILPFLRSTAST